jgi:glycerophosphoryl diester phosphodiesterase
MSHYNDNNSPLILAHRGGAGEFPQNSLEAFSNAIKIGMTHLETDVRVDANNILYLQHTATSCIPNQPVTPKRGALRLEQLFNILPTASYAIDPKHELAVKPLAELIVACGLQKQVCIGSSFDGRSQRTADLVETISGVRPFTAMVSAVSTARLVFNTINRQKLQADYVHVHVSLVNSRTIQNAHQNGLKIIAWVVNDSKQMIDMLAMGVDGFMTDYPSRATEVMGKRRLGQ